MRPIGSGFRGVTVLTLVMAGLQIGLLWWQIRIYDRQRELMRRQADVMDGQRSAMDAQGATMASQLVALQAQGSTMSEQLATLKAQNETLAGQLAAATVAADAAQKSATTADISLKLAYRPYLMFRKLKVTDDLNDRRPSGIQKPNLRVSYDLFNASRNRADLRDVSITHAIHGSARAPILSGWPDVRVTISPDRAFPFTIVIAGLTDEENDAYWSSKGLLIDITIQLVFRTHSVVKHPQTIQRRVWCNNRFVPVAAHWLHTSRRPRGTRRDTQPRLTRKALMAGG
jgi:hypothetical protein